MDLIYMNASKEDLGVMQDYVFDLAFGSDENDFECVISEDLHCCETGFFLYIEGTEYGGIIDGIEVKTADNEIRYFGRTWHGILNSKILEPNPGANYLVYTGDANIVLDSLISRMGLNDLFMVLEMPSRINISSYKMNRYIGGYDGIRKMLKEYGAKLQVSFEDGFVVLSAVPLVDYSKDEQFDADAIDFNIRKNNAPVNHVVCLGKGELSAREVIHLYADENGSIGKTQSLTGIDEVAAVYDNANAETSEELENGGKELLAQSWASDEIEFNFSSDDERYDIGDVVGAKERITGIEVSSEVTKKIVTIRENGTTIRYETGDK